MELVEAIKTIILTQYEWYKFLTSEQLFFRLGPVCLVLESVIVYIYLAREKEYNNQEERKKSFKLYWKLTAFKIGFMLYLTCLILNDTSRSLYIELMGIMLAYYVYTAILVFCGIIYIFAKNNNQQRVKNIASILNATTQLIQKNNDIITQEWQNVQWYPMSFVDIIKPAFLTQYEWYDFLTSEWLFFRLGPVCLVVESVILYILCTCKKAHDDEGKSNKNIKQFWKITIFKTSLILYLTYLILTDSGWFTYSSLMNIMLYYYIYTALLIMIIVVSLFIKVVKDMGKVKRNSVKQLSESSDNFDNLKSDFKLLKCQKWSH